MKTTRNVLIIIAAVCIFCGIVITAGAFAASGLNFLHWSDHGNYEEKTYYVSENFEKVDISSVDADISIMPVDGAEARVECLTSERVNYDVKVTGSTLKITRRDNTKWWEHIGFFVNVPSFDIKVYLPAREYKALDVNSVSGNVIMEEGLSFGDVCLKTVSGDIDTYAVISGDLEIKTTSGEMRVNSFGGKRLSLYTTSGDAELYDVTAEYTEFSSVSGDMELTYVISEKGIEIKTTSGDIKFNGCDSDDISVKTVSGDVKGSFLSEKDFDVHTVSGDVRVPYGSSSAQRCKISTTSGDVNIVIK